MRKLKENILHSVQNIFPLSYPLLSYFRETVLQKSQPFWFLFDFRIKYRLHRTIKEVNHSSFNYLLASSWFARGNSVVMQTLPEVTIMRPFRLYFQVQGSSRYIRIILPYYIKFLFSYYMFVGDIPFVKNALSFNIFATRGFKLTFYFCSMIRF